MHGKGGIKSPHLHPSPHRGEACPPISGGDYRVRFSKPHLPHNLYFLPLECLVKHFYLFSNFSANFDNSGIVSFVL
jgi:hypothetical protein